MDKAKKVLSKMKKIFKTTMKTFGVMILVLTFTGIGAAIYLGVQIKPLMDDAQIKSYDKLSKITDNTFMQNKDTVVYDNEGNELAKINAGRYEYVEIQDVSKWLQEGYIAVEDRNFKTHNGIDYKAITRAAVEIVKNKGKITQGGSTITQQVIKNNLITEEKKFDRKMVEFFLAPQLEKEYSKGKIMEFYINTNSYGNNNEGVGSASRYYFNKSVKDLEIHEAALLVGISNNPTKYNPKSNPEVAKQKRDFVLGIMMEEEVITEYEYEQARAKELDLALYRADRDKETYLTSYALHSATLKMMEIDDFKFEYTFRDKEKFDEYKKMYAEVYSDASNKIRGGGYEIYTSLDVGKQAIIQEVLDKHLSIYKERAEDGRYALQGSAVLVDNSTGYVEAIVGGRGTEDEFNRGFLGVRQPGSAIKPIISYGPAYDSGLYYPSKKLKDAPIKDGPKNAGGGYRGEVSLREALGRSINTIAYNLLVDIGPNKGLEYLDKMRFSNLTWQDNNNNSLALGGFTYGTTVVDMAKAYSTIVNYGEYSDATCITKIEFQNEGVIFDGKISYNMVYSTDTAYMLLDGLQSIIEQPYGTGGGLKLNGITAGGKTGTTNQQKDAWFVGVTPTYSLAVWAGYDTPRPTNMYGSGAPGKIWQESMNILHKDTEDRVFTRPETIVERSINYRGERVDKETGNVDIFSYEMIAQEERLIAEKIEKDKRDRQLRLDAEIDFIVENIEGLVTKDIKDIPRIYDQHKMYMIKIVEMDDKDKKLVYDNRINTAMKDTSQDIKDYEKKLRDDERKLELEKQQEELEKQQENVARLREEINNDINKIIFSIESIRTEEDKEKALARAVVLYEKIMGVPDEYLRSDFMIEHSDIVRRIKEVYIEREEERVENGDDDVDVDINKEDEGSGGDE